MNSMPCVPTVRCRRSGVGQSEVHSVTEPGSDGQSYAGVAARGSAWTLGGLLVGEPVRLIATAVLARLLTPEDFGVVGMASVFVGLAWIGNDMGFTTALIQKKEVSSEERDSVFWMNLVIGLVLTGLAYLLSPLVSAAYGDDRVGPVFALLGVSFTISSLFLVQNASLRREMDFKTTSIAGIVLTSMMGITGIGYAVAGLGYWSLALGNLTALLLWGVVLQARSGYLPKHGFRWSHARSCGTMGGELTIGDGLAYVTSNVDNYFVGRSLGAASLGVYSLAYNLTSFPMRKVARLIGSVVLPVYSRINEDAARLGRAYVSSIRAVAFVELPVLAVAAVEADRLIVGLYGEPWVGAVPLFRILVVAAAAGSLAVFGEMLLKGMGLTREFLGWSTISLLAVGVGVFFGLPSGVVGVAWGVAGAWTLSALGLLWYAGRQVEVGMMHVLRSILPALVLTVACALAARATDVVLARWVEIDLLIALGGLVVGVIVPWAVLRKATYFKGILALEALLMQALGRRGGVEVDDGIG